MIFELSQPLKQQRCLTDTITIRQQQSTAIDRMKIVIFLLVTFFVTVSSFQHVGEYKTLDVRDLQLQRQDNVNNNDITDALDRLRTKRSALAACVVRCLFRLRCIELCR